MSLTAEQEKELLALFEKGAANLKTLVGNSCGMAKDWAAADLPYNLWAIKAIFEAAKV